MQSTKVDHASTQQQATLDEYAGCVREGNDTRVKNIRNANPELVKNFDHIDANTLVTV
jgi:hypothetical protein